ncbi:MAG: DNA polymerase III subunit delta [Muribaculaceae bacterium]|nr:DNA polymerase III subunit delta [Muribaculaceae bacterium]
MAKKGSAFREILTEIRKGNFANVYVLMGDEAYYIDKIVEALEERVVAEDDRDFNLTAYYGNEIEIPLVIATAQQFPVMSDRRLVLVKEAQALQNAKSELDKLSEYVKRPAVNTVLVIVYKGDSLNATSALLKAVAKSDGVIFQSKKLRDYELPVPIKDYCQSKHIGISEQSIKMLCEYCGADLSKLFGEIDKLIVAGGKDLLSITPELIEKNIGVSKDFNNFELVNALRIKDYDKTLRIIDYFRSNPAKNPTVMTTAMLYGFYSKLVTALYLKDKSDQSLIAALQIKNQYSLNEWKQAMRNYSASQAIGAIHALREFDAKSKGIGSMQNEYDLLRELIYTIFILR